MASIGEPHKNVDESSDIVHDFPCKPCSDDGKNVECVNFCAECQTYFCKSCVAFHNKCFKTHTLFNKAGVKSGRVQAQQQPDELTCDQHPGYPIQMYCKEHDSVCCAVCVAVYHRLCKNADFIPKLSKEILNGRDRKDVKNSLEEMKKTFMKIKSTKVKEIDEVNKEKENIVTEIEKMKERIIARVEEIEKNSIKQVQDKHKETIDNIKYRIETIDAKIMALDTSIKKIHDFKGSNEAKLFVILNKAHEVESSCGEYLESNDSLGCSPLAFQFNRSYEFVLKDVESFCFVEGCGSDQTCPGSVAMASLVGELNVMYENESSCCIVDCCVLDNGQVIIVDQTNGCLKRLDREFNLKDSCNVYSPRGLCKSDRNEVAVTSYDTVQFIHVERSMIPTRSFRLPEQITIQGYASKYFILSQIVLKKSNLYIVATYGNLVAVVACDRNGSVIRCIDIGKKSTNCGFSMSFDGSLMFFAFYGKGIITINLNGEIVSQASNERLKKACNVIEGENGQLFVCDLLSHTVFLADKDGKNFKELLGRFDGICSPLSIVYIRSQRRLVVSGRNKFVQIFQLT